MNTVMALLCTLLRRIDRAGRRHMLRTRIAQLQTLLARPGIDKHESALPRLLYEAHLAALRCELQALEQQR